MVPSHGRISSSKTPATPVVGCRRRYRPMLRLEHPERRSNAGVLSAPAATTTVRAWTTTRLPAAVSTSTPDAAPLLKATLRARAPATILAPACCASTSHVLAVDCLAPSRHP